MNHFLILRILINALLPMHVAGQVMDENSCKNVRLYDGVEVKVCASADNQNYFYYLPGTLQLSVSGGMPQISLLVYKEGADDKIAGGILHFLFQWGLTPNQEKDLQNQVLTLIDSGAVVMGAADISFKTGDVIKFMPPDESMARILSSSLSQPLKIAPGPTSKSAVSARLSPEDALQVWNVFMRPDSGKPISMVCNYTYPVVEYDGLVRTSVERQGTLKATLSDWIREAKKYNNAKIIKQ